ncbi:hypothetical protein A6R68_17565, partial [Neotoma lepida]
MSHVLQFEDKSRKVKDASMQDSDTFEIYDPRNPVNKRRREESKKLLREKKERSRCHKDNKVPKSSPVSAKPIGKHFPDTATHCAAKTTGIDEEDSRRENMIVYLRREMRIFVYAYMHQHSTTQKENLRKYYKGKTYKPLDLWPKKTRVMRCQLTKHEEKEAALEGEAVDLLFVLLAISGAGTFSGIGQKATPLSSGDLKLCNSDD